MLSIDASPFCLEAGRAGKSRCALPCYVRGIILGACLVERVAKGAARVLLPGV